MIDVKQGHFGIEERKGDLVIPPQSQKANLHIIPWPICFSL